MSHPFGENLEVWTESGNSWIRCLRCGHLICPMGHDWKQACTKRVFPPTKAGPLMDVLADRYVLEQRYCPSCGALLEANIAEAAAAPGDGTARG